MTGRKTLVQVHGHTRYKMDSGSVGEKKDRPVNVPEYDHFKHLHDDGLQDDEEHRQYNIIVPVEQEQYDEEYEYHPVAQVRTISEKLIEKPGMITVQDQFGLTSFKDEKSRDANQKKRY